MSRVLMALPLATFALAGALVALALMRADPPAAPGSLVGEPFPQMELPALRGGAPMVTGAASFQGPAVVNIFASWCAPCRAEHPILMRLAADGARLYGVAWKDAPLDAEAFLDELGDPFAVALSDRDGRLGDRLGVTGAPETFVIGADGKVRAHWRGPLTAREVGRLIAPALAEADAPPPPQGD
ncbi:MAG: DsbE family thiol:disulfide interchange protein [Caulobacterales bacterium]|nr:DsbE family thiol:disulfide interchange protein [Caulobacterales bacterium]